VIGVIVNPRSGYVARHGLDHLRTLVVDEIPHARIHVLEKGDNVGEACRDFLAAGATCLVAVGGDGTVASVATSLVGGEIPLGVIPGGTLNHFAEDVGVGRDVSRAIQCLNREHIRVVDVATVNNKVFINNSSIGLYPRMVQIRERYQKHLTKWQAMIRASMIVAQDVRPTTIHLSNGNKDEVCSTYLVFVGNNVYDLNLTHLGKRQKLDAGELGCVILEDPGKLRFLPLIFRFLRDKDTEGRHLRLITAQELTVMPNSTRKVHVAADGEVFRMAAPLVYRSLPRALRVVAPELHP
jgi:diacylglycerol kinase family enzyme